MCLLVNTRPLQSRDRGLVVKPPCIWDTRGLQALGENNTKKLVDSFSKNLRAPLRLSPIQIIFPTGWGHRGAARQGVQRHGRREEEGEELGGVPAAAERGVPGEGGCCEVWTGTSAANRSIGSTTGCIITEKAPTRGHY